VQVLSGLAAGEAVVTGANFLLDSESRLRGAWSGTDSQPSAAPPAAPAAHSHGGTP